MIWLLGGYTWLFIHRPFEVWPALGAWHVEKIYMIITILYWALFAEKNWVSNRLNGRFLFFWIVVAAAWVVSPYVSACQQTGENYFKMVVLYILIISTVRTERDLRFLVNAFLVSMALYMAHSLREYCAGRAVYRMGTTRMVAVDSTIGDPNSFAALIICSLPLLFAVWPLLRQSWQRGLAAGYVVLSATCVLLTGSRMGLLGLLALSAFIGLQSKRRLAIILVLAIAAPVAWTFLPSDRKERYMTIIDPSHGPANAQESAEGRTWGFLNGLKLLGERPVLGFGPGAFGKAIGNNTQAHNIYGQTLGETGAAGGLAFLGIVLGIVGNFFEARRLFRADPEHSSAFCYRLSLSVLTTMILLLIMGWAGHFLYWAIWLWFGAYQAIALHCMRRDHLDRLEVASAQCDNSLRVGETV